MGDRFCASGQGPVARLRPRGPGAGRGITPVWNKSNREHTIIGSEPPASAPPPPGRQGTRLEKKWHVDADHIRLETVDKFLGSSDFFTVDVADSIGKPGAGSDPVICKKAS
jgi:tagaturonate epimerase